MASPPYYGGCQCRANRYTISGPMFVINFCHCSACRRLSGAPFLPFIQVLVSSFTWTSKDNPSPTLKELHLSSVATRTFCSSCGTPLTMQYKPDSLWVTGGSVDDEHAQTVKELVERGLDGAKQTSGEKPIHIFKESQSPWADFGTLAKIPACVGFGTEGLSAGS